MNIEKALKANRAIEDLKSAILSSTVITIRDLETRELLWSCATDETYGWLAARGAQLDIEQDIDLDSVLSQLQHVLKTIEADDEKA